jgi:peptidoglycan hydrolase-like protein with peptidoglycan-binding domain
MEPLKLRIGDLGSDVARIQEQLALHGVEVSAEEKKQQFFGPSTRDAVRTFQKTNGIDPSCEVCQETAKLLAVNPALETTIQPNLGSIATSSNDLIKTETVVVPASVAAPIVAPLRMGDRSPEVINLQTGLIKIIDKQFLRLSMEDQKVLRDGLIQEQQQQIYSEFTIKVVSAFQEKSQLNSTGEVDRSTAEALNNILQELGVSSSITVRGRITDANRKGLSKYIIILSEYDLDGAVQIARSIADDDGTFEFQFDNTDVLKQGDSNTAPDLMFQILDTNETERTIKAIFMLSDDREISIPRIAVSPKAPIVLVNVSSMLILRIVADLQQRDLTEFEQLITRLSPFMRQVGFADLKEDDENFQISFLSKESGVDKIKIEQLRDAFKQERAFDNVPTWAFFGLASNNITLASIAAMPIDGIISILKPLQPSEDLLDLASVAKNLKQFVQERSISITISDLKTSVGELLKPILSSETKLDNFLDAYARHEGDIEIFWQKMSENAEFKAEVPKIQLNLQLSQLTLNNRGLIDALQKKGIDNTRQLVDIPIQDWESLALEHKADIPLHIIGENDLERSRIYAQELQTLVEIAFPTDVIKKSIVQPTVSAFLTNNPKFDFTTTPVDTYLHEQKQALEGIENPEEVSDRLRHLQRIYTLTANTVDMNVLVDLQYQSAHQISKFSVEDFTRSVTGKISAVNAEVYHAKAVAISEAAVMLHHHLRDLAVSTTPSATKNLSEDTTALKSIPNWESLFGSLDTCECQHCKSVYSPAAYFVDLLHILLGQNKGAARIEIFRRRPDLMYTKLSCEHTETLIPYIDLVNEVLETYVAQKHVGDGDAQTHAKDSTNDTSSFTAPDLAANPQHPNQKANDDANQAYALLKGATFPLNLPFDMDLEVARQFLQEQNSSRFEVMKTFGNATSHATAAEHLGISDREFEILTLKQLDGTTDALNVAVSDLWGKPIVTPGQSLGQTLSIVNIFLDLAGITYKDLRNLLNTHFLNPNFPINIYLQDLSEAERIAWTADRPNEDGLAKKVIELWIDPAAPCDLKKTQIKHLNEEFLSDEELTHFNRFIRLWKKLGCTIAELDKLLMAMGATNLTPQVIQDLASLWQVHQDLDISLDRVAVLVGNIPTMGKDSLFAKLFLNKAILQIDDKFALNIFQTELKTSTETLQKHVPAILAAMQISEVDFDRIVIYTSLNLTTDFLNLANLSKIYRYVVFAKGLSISIGDLVNWLDSIPQLPWSSIADLVKTKKLIEKVNYYGFKAADFAYIFQGKTVAGNMLPPKDEIINQSAKVLREGLLKIYQENTPKDGIITVDFLRMALGILLEAEEVTKILGILDGSNTQNKFDYLLTPQISANYKGVLENYLTAADITDLSSTIDIPERSKKYWDKIGAKLLPALRKTFIQQHLIATFKLDAALVTFFLQDATILQTCLDIETITPAHTKAYADLYILMHKCLWLIGKLDLSAKELSYFQNNANFDNFNWKTFNFAAWLQIANFVDLRSTLPVSKQDIISIFEAAKNGGDITKAIIEVTAWEKTNVQYFVSKLTATDFLNEISLTRLRQQIELSQKIGVSIEKLTSWSIDIFPGDLAQDVKRSLKTKYSETTWIEVSTQVHNRLRSQLRNALVAYLLQKPEIKDLGLKDTNDLYSYFLIDVEMDSCMLTSRLKQAISSVQLFVQRCLLNLESLKAKPEQIISPKMIVASQWQWMKSYRVWEANRKVFLYPENWIEPELRDNKSPFFKELESELLQGEVTNDSVEKALINYLEKLHDVARLDICGTCEDPESQEMHVFGRTFNSPHQYFHRKLDLRTQIWTAWEKLQLDIQGNEDGDSAGVHLIPVIWNRRLYLFWPIFTEKPDREEIKKDKERYKKLKQDSKNQLIKDNEDIDNENRQIDREIEKKEKEIRGDICKSWTKYEALGITWYQVCNSYSEDEQKQRVEKMKNVLNAGKKEHKIEQDITEESFPWAYWEIRLAWSEYKNKKWSNKKVSQSFIRTASNISGVEPTYLYRFTPALLDNTLQIRLFQQFPYNYGLVLLSIGEYQLNCNGKLSVKKQENLLSINSYVSEQVSFYQSLILAQTSGSQIKWNDRSSFSLKLQSGSSKNSSLLSNSEGEYRLFFSADHSLSYNGSSRFIYQDRKRNYFVDPQYYSRHVFLDTIKRVNKSVILSQKQIPLKILVATDKNSIIQPQKIDRFNQLSSAEINQIVDQKQIMASTAMQVRSMQTLSTPVPVEISTKSLPSLAKVEQLYLNTNIPTTTKLQFKPFFHAHVCKFIEALDRNGVDGLLNLSNQQLSDLKFTYKSGGIAGGAMPFPAGITNNFNEIYSPDKNNTDTPYPIEDVDFSSAGAYSLYNWELFFHLPMLVANRLSKNQKFQEAMRWYHFVFNPTTNDSQVTAARYWQVIPLRNTPNETLEELFNQLKNPASDPKRRELEDAITAWRNNPFNPHSIARIRSIAYQKNAVMKYLDNLIIWADKLFYQDTIESINEATQLYILAAELLGKHPTQIPAIGKIQTLNYAELEKNLDAFSNASVKLETIFPFYNFQPVQPGKPGASSILSTTVPITLYFCLPDNSKLLSYWDTIADRLFKIRHCQNIEGVERQLALFEPPIDPALLVQAVAGGVDINSVLADLNSPLPHYRFSYIVQKALEICSELKSLGNSLLSALEKRDSETMSMMRSQHETHLLDLAKTIKKLQINEARYGKEGLEKTRAVTEHRANFYTQLINDGLNNSEKEHHTLGVASMALSAAGQYLEMAASLAQPIPNTNVGAIAGPAGGVTNSNHIGGGDKTAKALSAFGRYLNMISSMTSFAASSAQTNAGYERRANDWKLQQDLANQELAQIDKQILAARIREKIADRDLVNHEQQTENARQVEEFLRNKYTQEELYGWTIGEISTIYFQCYQLAYDLAKKAEKTYRYELGLPTSNFVQFGIWDSFRKGLMSGERLYLSLKQMEKSYMDQNRREYEIVKHISLLQLNPLATIALKETGTCILELPEAFFDADYPGHYMRRIKSVSITIPCVVGPYTSINCTLTLLSSETRIKSLANKPYEKNAGSDDNRFITNYAAMQSIATSTAQNDSGLFELNFRDERYLPFEGAGAVSRWRIDLPKDCNAFDFDTISDVIIKLNYTAREGGDNLKKVAKDAMQKMVKEKSPLARLFSVKHEFSSEWYRFLHPAEAANSQPLNLDFSLERFPFQYRGKKLQISKLEIFLNLKEGIKPGTKKTYTEAYTPLKITITPPGAAEILQDIASKKSFLNGIPYASIDGLSIDIKSGSDAIWSLIANMVSIKNDISDLFIICHYSVG